MLFIRVISQLIKRRKLTLASNNELITRLLQFTDDRVYQLQQGKLLFNCLAHEQKLLSVHANGFLNQETGLAVKLCALKALIVRGDAVGYKELQATVESNLSNPNPSFVSLFSLIVTKPVKPE